MPELLPHIESWKSPACRFQEITCHLTLTAFFHSDLSLYNGKMGLVLFFFHYLRHTDQPWYEDIANELLADIRQQLHADMPTGFAEGLCGIGWGLEYLVQNKFLEGNTTEALAEFDTKIMETDPLRLSDLSLETGLAGIVCYVMIRLSSSLQNKQSLPFDTRYLKNLEERLNAMANDEEEYVFTCYKKFMYGEKFVYDPQQTLVRFLNKVVPDSNPEEWTPGLADGCSGYILKHILQ